MVLKTHIVNTLGQVQVRYPRFSQYVAENRIGYHGNRYSYTRICPNGFQTHQLELSMDKISFCAVWWGYMLNNLSYDTNQLYLVKPK